MPTEQVNAYRCQDCDALVLAQSDAGKDRPEGYYVHMRRVTESGVQSVTGEMFFDEKECLVHYMQYGISRSTTPQRPIGGEHRPAYRPVRNEQ